MGRWGPYIAYKKKNYKIPAKEAENAANLSLEDCKRIMEEDSKKPVRKRQNRCEKGVKLLHCNKRRAELLGFGPPHNFTC